MSSRRSRIVARVVLVVLALASMPVAAQPQAGARLEGFVLGVDGRAAGGLRVHLIDDAGRDVAQAATDGQGVYRFRDLASGAYSLGIESAEGGMAPVAAPPVRLGRDELARRDVKLVDADVEQRERAGKENASFGIYWAGLSPGAKAWSVIGVFVIVGITIEALDDGETRGTQN